MEVKACFTLLSEIRGSILTPCEEIRCYSKDTKAKPCIILVTVKREKSYILCLVVNTDLHYLPLYSICIKSPCAQQ